MRQVLSLSELPNVPAVYAMYGGSGCNAYVADVGIGDPLKRRAGQHLVRRDSSVVTAASAVSLSPDSVTEVRCWEHPESAGRRALQAAELVALDVLDEPALRSTRGRSASSTHNIILLNPLTEAEWRIK